MSEMSGKEWERVGRSGKKSKGVERCYGIFPIVMGYVWFLRI